MTETEDRGGGIQVIARAASILRVLSGSPGGLSLGAIAGRIGLARSTVQRIVQALEAEGFVELSDRGEGFRLGPSLAQLVYHRQVDIVAEVRPQIEALCNELQETVALCTMMGSSLTTIDRCVGEQPLRVVFPLGAIPFPAYRMAPGRAILAELPVDDARRLLGEMLPKAKVERELAAIAEERDAARDVGTFIADLSGFAVPLRTRLGLYAIAAILPTSRVEDRMELIFSTLRSARDAVEERIGTREVDGATGR